MPPPDASHQAAASVTWGDFPLLSTVLKVAYGRKVYRDWVEALSY
jgi:hypothetical protein